MSDRISPRSSTKRPDVEDWRVVLQGANAIFRTGSFSVGLQLVDAIGRLAEAADHHPDIDLRYREVAVRLRSHDVGGLSERDIMLARRISAAARDLDVRADPGSRSNARDRDRCTCRFGRSAFLGSRARLSKRGSIGAERPAPSRPIGLVSADGLLRGRSVIASISTSLFPTTRPSHASGRPSLREATLSPMNMPRPGGFWRTPRATRPA